MKTYSAKPADVTHNWVVVDAKDVVLGRLASQVAMILRGKHKPIFSPNIDCGDHVVIVNARHVKLKGNNKLQQKIYYRHTGYAGGLKETTAEKVLNGRFPERVVEKAVERMLPKTIMGRNQMGKLRVYAEDSHPHEAQQPNVLDLAAKNPKNKR